jgi:hemerythrin superfamily protein
MYGDHTPGQLPENNDVVLWLSNQHERIRELLDAVGDGSRTEREHAFHELVKLVTIHETVEERILHPRVGRELSGGERIVARRIEEERRIRDSLRRMEAWGIDDPRFDEEFRTLRKEFLSHAQAEENDEFAPFRRGRSSGELQALAKSARIAGSFAPTHPHPRGGSETKGFAHGPVTVVLDRARDALHTARDGLTWLRSWYVH